MFLVSVEQIQWGTAETGKWDCGEPAFPCSPRSVCLTVLCFLPFTAEKVGAYTKWMSEEVQFSLSAFGNQPDTTLLGALHLKAGEEIWVLLTTQKKEMQKMPSLSVQPGDEGRSPPAVSCCSFPYVSSPLEDLSWGSAAGRLLFAVGNGSSSFSDCVSVETPARVLCSRLITCLAIFLLSPGALSSARAFPTPSPLGPSDSPQGPTLGKGGDG